MNLHNYFFVGGQHLDSWPTSSTLVWLIWLVRLFIINQSVVYFIDSFGWLVGWLLGSGAHIKVEK